jgi:hypothetical protein
MTNQIQKTRLNRINTLNANAYTNAYTNAYANGYAKHMFIVYSFIVYLFKFNF